MHFIFYWFIFTDSTVEDATVLPLGRLKKNQILIVIRKLDITNGMFREKETELEKQALLTLVIRIVIIIIHHIFIGFLCVVLSNISTLFTGLSSVGNQRPPFNTELKHSKVIPTGRKVKEVKTSIPVVKQTVKTGSKTKSNNEYKVILLLETVCMYNYVCCLCVYNLCR